MRVGLVAAIIFIFACLAILSSTMNGESMSAADNNTMSNVTVVRGADTTSSIWGTVLTIVLAPIHWVQGLVNMASWNYAFLDNTPGQYFKWIIGGPITGALVAGLILMFIWLLYKVL